MCKLNLSAAHTEHMPWTHGQPRMDDCFNNQLHVFKLVYWVLTNQMCRFNVALERCFTATGDLRQRIERILDLAFTDRFFGGLNE